MTGFDTPLGDGSTLIGNVFCLPGIAGILTDVHNCVNIRRLCELGVGLDENRQNVGLGEVNNRIDNRDVEATYVRGAFAFLNGLTTTSPAQFDEIKFDSDVGSNFGHDNGTLYSQFRQTKLLNDIKERENSFYFYFGLINGNGALTKMNKKFFTEGFCEFFIFL